MHNKRRLSERLFAPSPLQAVRNFGRWYSWRDMKKLPSIWIVLAIFISGCSGSSGESTEIELIGTWDSQCGVTDGRIAEYAISFAEQQVTYSYVYFYVYYNAEDCIEQSDDTLISTTTYRLGQSILASSGNSAYEIDIDILSEGEYLYTKQDIVSVINSQLYFGVPISEEACDPNELVDLATTTRPFCNQRPVELDFDKPFIQRI